MSLSMVRVFIVLLFSKSLISALYLPNGDAQRLISNILAANNSLEDDIIDLGGHGYLLDETTGIFPHTGLNGLPVIAPSIVGGKLAIINGTIKRDPLAVLLFRFFYIESGASLSLFNVTLVFGSIANDPFPVSDADNGGAIYNMGRLHINQCVLASNLARGSGGAIYNRGQIEGIAYSQLMNNEAKNSGGAVYNDAGIVKIDTSSLSNNKADNSGGALLNASNLIEITNSTISNNFATVFGGGIFNIANIPDNISNSVVIVSNSTVAKNGALSIGLLGGGIANSGTLYSYNNTIANNSSNTGGGIFNQGVIESLYSSIVAENIVSNTGKDIYNFAGSLINNEGYNLLSFADSNSGITNGVNNNIVTSASLLDDLKYNGVPTQTMALLPGSLAINNGLNPLNLFYDQRGFSFRRTIFSRPDIGAFEYQSLIFRHYGAAE